MGFKLVDNYVLPSAASTVTIGGGSSGSSTYNYAIPTSTNNPHFVVIQNVGPSTDDVSLYCRVTKSGSADTTSNYDHAAKILRNNTSFSNTGGNNASSATFAFSLGNGTNEKANAVLYLYNFADTSEYSFVVVESIFQDLTPNLLSYTGGIVHTVASASDGVSFTMESGVNINAGAEFTLYGLKK